MLGVDFNKLFKLGGENPNTRTPIGMASWLQSSEVLETPQYSRGFR